MQYSLCAELSKLTGAVCVSVDYRLPPDNGAIITDALSDAFKVYRHLIENSASVSRNEDADGILVNDPKRYFQRIAVGEIDINLEKRYGRDEDKPSLTDARFSPLFGDWAGLCPIYFMVGA